MSYINLHVLSFLFVKIFLVIPGKKFKGPDFVRKHIFNKHAEKVDEVKKEVSTDPVFKGTAERDCQSLALNLLPVLYFLSPIY
jgi:hypothetical protein